MKTILENEIFNISAFTENKNYEYNKQNILANLPKELIALYPKKPRDQSSLLVNGKKNKIIKIKRR